MPIENVPDLRTAPSTNPDGYDLTVEEACRMSAEEFERTFGHGLKGLEAVPFVGEGFLTRAPLGCQYYVRERRPPKNPGPKDRKEVSYELMVKSPLRALPEAGGAIAVAPKRIGLKAKDADSARLEALVLLARKQGRGRRATDWPIGRIQALRVVAVLDRYVAVELADPLPGVEEDPVAFETRRHYRYSVKAFQKAFPELEVGDVGDWIVKVYHNRAANRSPWSRTTDLYIGRRALKGGLKLMGVPPTYNCHFDVPDIGAPPKVAWTVDEFDRLRAGADGWVFGPGGVPKMVPGPEGPVQMRRFDPHVWLSRGAWRRAIDFLTYTVSRNGRLAQTRWVPPEAEPMDGLPLPDRPWIEVLDDEIRYHRDGERRYDGGKRRRGNKIPKELEPTVRAWYEEDLAMGYEFVFHKKDGSRYRRYLSKETFQNIVKDAAIDGRRIPHHLKDLSVDWSDEAGIDREVLAAHADTSMHTLGRKYGDPLRGAFLEQAAETMSQGPWRERGERKAKVTRLFREARAENLAKAGADSGVEAGAKRTPKPGAGTGGAGTAPKMPKPASGEPSPDLRRRRAGAG